jgi:hypothetical protein
MEFRTEDEHTLHKMIEYAVKSGLTFEAIDDRRAGIFILKYTGGY